MFVVNKLNSDTLCTLSWPLSKSLKERGNIFSKTQSIFPPTRHRQYGGHHLLLMEREKKYLEEEEYLSQVRIRKKLSLGVFVCGLWTICIGKELIKPKDCSCCSG